MGLYIPSYSAEFYTEILSDVTLEEAFRLAEGMGEINDALNDRRLLLDEEATKELAATKGASIVCATLVSAGFSAGYRVLTDAGVVIPFVPHANLNRFTGHSEDQRLDKFLIDPTAQGYIEATIQWGEKHADDKIGESCLSVGFCDLYISAERLIQANTIWGN